MATDRLMNLLNTDNEDESVVTLNLNQLEFYENSPFKIYDGEKKEKLAESIQNSGLISPIVVMPSQTSRGKFKILCGANRVDACKILGYKDIKAVIKSDLTEEQAIAILVESNLFNRSIDDMLPSELAFSLKLRYDALKKQGKRTDLETTSGTECQKFQNLIDGYKLSDRNIRNYIRLTYLHKELLDFIDSGVVSIKSGVQLSYIREEEQIQLSELIQSHGYNIKVNIAEIIRKLSSESSVTIDLKSVLEGMFKVAEKKDKPIKIDIVDVKEFIPEIELKNAKDIIIKALRLYYQKNM